jgi:hypothetical protein
LSGGCPLLVLSGLLPLRFLRPGGALFAICLLALGRGRTSLAPFAGAHLALLSGSGLIFSTLFAGFTHLLLLLAVPGDRLGSLDLLSSSADL